MQTEYAITGLASRSNAPRQEMHSLEYEVQHSIAASMRQDHWQVRCMLASPSATVERRRLGCEWSTGT